MSDSAQAALDAAIAMLQAMRDAQPATKAGKALLGVTYQLPQKHRGRGWAAMIAAVEQEAAARARTDAQDPEPYDGSRPELCNFPTGTGPCVMYKHKGGGHISQWDIRD